jgi:hypothetical protein
MYVTVEPSGRTIVTDLPASYVRTVPATDLELDSVVEDATPGAVVSVVCCVISWCVVPGLAGSGAAGVVPCAPANAAKPAIMPAEMSSLDFMVSPFLGRRPIPALLKESNARAGDFRIAGVR